ncbi:MAG TPA: hypothetical protein VKH46_12715 [Thermoanaerobaculia bacterium]|nr:hypothetical protein [Thermoanaerobaculia bacterium]
MKTRSNSSDVYLAVASFLLAGLVSAGCTSMTMTPGARRVVTRTAASMKACKPRGVVFALAPFLSLEQPLDQLKIRAHQIGADTLVLLGPAGTRTKDWSARAYRCGKVPSRNLDATPFVTAAR